MQIFAATDQGKVRTNNEDFVCWDVARGLAVLADGMGGLNAGEIASEVAATSAMKVLHQQTDCQEVSEQSRLLIEAINTANEAVFELSSTRYDYQGMGTTLVVSRVVGDTCFVAHVGDSRIYRYANGQLEQVGQDHSVVQQLVNEGLLTPEKARHAPNRNIITRAVGINECVESESNQVALAKGEMVILCSDGLSDMVEDRIIQNACTRLAREPEKLPGELIRLANERGGIDNISVIVLTR